MLRNPTAASSEKPTPGAPIFVKSVVSLCFFLAAAMIGLGLLLTTKLWAVDLSASKLSEVIVACPGRIPDSCLEYNLIASCGHPFIVKSLFVCALFFVFSALALLKFRRKEAKVYKFIYVATGFTAGIGPVIIFGGPIPELLSLGAAFSAAVTAMVASPFVASRIASIFSRGRNPEHPLPSAEDKSLNFEAAIHIAGLVLGIWFIANVFSFSFCV